MKKTLLSILQLEFGIGIIVYFIIKLYIEGRLSQLVTAISNAAANWHLLVFATLPFLFCLVLCNMRWQALLRAQDIRLSYGKSFVLYFIGHFFSMFLPGATTGDVLKAVYLAREAPTRRTEAVSTIVIDRMVGLMALVLLSTVMMLIRLDFFMSLSVTRIALLMNSCFLLGAILLSLVVFRKNIFEHFAFFRKLQERTALGKIISRIYTAFHVCVGSWRILAVTTVLSMANHILFIGSTCLIGAAIGISLSVYDYFTVFPIINTFAGLPITPGGLGVRDAAAKFLLGALGVAAPEAISLSLLLYLVTLFWSFVGGIIYAIFVFRGDNRVAAVTNIPPA